MLTAVIPHSVAIIFSASGALTPVTPEQSETSISTQVGEYRTPATPDAVIDNEPPFAIKKITSPVDGADSADGSAIVVPSLNRTIAFELISAPVVIVKPVACSSVSTNVAG